MTARCSVAFYPGRAGGAGRTPISAAPGAEHAALSAAGSDPWRACKPSPQGSVLSGRRLSALGSLHAGANIHVRTAWGQQSTQSRHLAAPAAMPAHSPKASLSQSLEGALSGHLVKRLAVLLR